MTLLRRLLLFGLPVALGAVLLAHPPDPEQGRVVEQLGDETTRWLGVHVGLLLALPLLGLWLWVVLEGVENAAANVARVAIVPFVALYAAFDAILGIGTGVLVREALAAQEAERAGAVALAETWWRVPAPVWVFSTLGPLSWLVACGAAAVAHFRAGSGLVVAGGLAIAAPFFGFGHPLITGPLAMLALLAIAVVLERRRGAATRRPGAPSTRAAGEGPA